MNSRTHSLDKTPFAAVRPLAMIVLIFILCGLCFSACSVAPRRLEISESWSQAMEDMRRVRNEQPAPQGPVSLYEAMARAVKFNRERRVKLMEAALADRQLELSEFDMLPKLAMEAGYEGRDPRSASSSESVRTGRTSLEASTSQDKDRAVGGVTFSWDLLDFGVSYLRARQQADRYLIAVERERKAVQILLRDVRKAWWEALSAQRLLEDIDPLTEKVEKALERSSKIEKARLQKPMEALTYQRSLLQILKTLQVLRRDLCGARRHLATLMGLPPMQEFRIADPGESPPVPDITWEDEAMEQAAMVLRPELNQARYQGSISRDDARAALLGVLPSGLLDVGWNLDSNSYLVDSNWLSYGIRVSWNLFQVFRGPRAMKAAEARQEVVDEQRLAVSMAVLMQIHLAKVHLVQSKRLFDLSDRYLNVQGRILEQMQATAAALKGEHAVIREELNHLLAEARRDRAFAEVQDGFGRLLVSLGIDVVPQAVESHALPDLADAIQENITGWQRCRLLDRLGLSKDRTVRLPEDPDVSLVPEGLPICTALVEASQAPPALHLNP